MSNIHRPVTSPCSTRWLAAGLALALAAIAGAACADELADKKLEEELRRDIAQAKADAAKARLGSIDTTDLPKGKGEASSLNVEGTILAYRAVDAIAQRIATITKTALGNSGRPVVIYHEQQLNAVMQYRTFQRQADLLQSHTLLAIGGEKGKVKLPKLLSDEMTCVAPPAPKTLSLDPINAALQVASLFKVDLKVEGRDVTVDEFALATAVLQKLGAEPGAVTSVAYPASYLPGVFAPGSGSLAKSRIVASVDELAQAQGTLDSLLTLIEARRATLARLLEAKPTPACKSAYEADLQTLLFLESKAKALHGSAERMQGLALAIDEKRGVSGLQQLLISEALSSQFERAFVLQLKPVAAGGATLTKTNLFRTRFLFSGGAIVSYLLFDGAGGQINAAGTIPYYAGFIPAEDLPAETPSR